jgi:hypothetical protein
MESAIREVSGLLSVNKYLCFVSRTHFTGCRLNQCGSDCHHRLPESPISTFLIGVRNGNFVVILECA